MNQRENMSAYYNEWDMEAAYWLRELIKRGLIADGIVDTRSITEVEAEELKEFTQWHLFAGIGVWSYALKTAGWPDTRPVMTGSPPCQPFSSAGKQQGTNDERHLWPAMSNLIKQLQPPVIFGEQVSSAKVVGKINGTSEAVWWDSVQADLERTSYASAAFDLPAAGFGCFHLRQRLYFCAERVADPIGEGLSGHGGPVEEPISEGRKGKKRHNTTSGAVDWVYCEDGKHRPIQPSISPLVAGTAKTMGRGSNSSLPINADETSEARVMRIRGYGNGLAAPVAIAFVSSYLESEFGAFA